MKKNEVHTLDREAVGIEFKIYAVDGVHGTLKELADYFNVDPVSVSDLMLSGMSIQDALCTADKGFKPKRLIDIELEKQRKLEEKEKKKNAIKQKKQVKVPVEKNDVVKVSGHFVDKTFAVKAQEDPLTKLVTNVQEFGDFVIVTTTTTMIYRKGDLK